MRHYRLTEATLQIIKRWFRHSFDHTAKAFQEPVPQLGVLSSLAFSAWAPDYAHRRSRQVFLQSRRSGSEGSNLSL